MSVGAGRVTHRQTYPLNAPAAASTGTRDKSGFTLEGKSNKESLLTDPATGYRKPQFTTTFIVAIEGHGLTTEPNDPLTEDHPPTRMILCSPLHIHAPAEGNGSARMRVHCELFIVVISSSNKWFSAVFSVIRTSGL